MEVSQTQQKNLEWKFQEQLDRSGVRGLYESLDPKHKDLATKAIFKLYGMEEVGLEIENGDRERIGKNGVMERHVNENLNWIDRECHGGTRNWVDESSEWIVRTVHEPDVTKKRNNAEAIFYPVHHYIKMLENTGEDLIIRVDAAFPGNSDVKEDREKMMKWLRDKRPGKVNELESAFYGSFQNLVEGVLTV